jgi:hypothetical protein
VVFLSTLVLLLPLVGSASLAPPLLLLLLPLAPLFALVLLLLSLLPLLPTAPLLLALACALSTMTPV